MSFPVSSQDKDCPWFKKFFDRSFVLPSANSSKKS